MVFLNKRNCQNQGARSQGYCTAMQQQKGCVSFIRTVTVGSGIKPDLLTLPNRSMKGARGLLPQLANTAGEEFHLALRTLPKAMHGHFDINEEDPLFFE